MVTKVVYAVPAMCFVWLGSLLAFITLSPWDQGELAINSGFVQWSFEPPTGGRTVVGVLIWALFSLSCLGAGAGLLWRATGKRPAIAAALGVLPVLLVLFLNL